MNRVRVSALAKTNLVLRILSRDPSGYHAIETLFALLDLSDELTVEKRDNGVSVDVSGADVGPERHNLAYKAAELILEDTGHQFGAHIHIDKSIPVQSGLGGGSSNGAAALLAVNKLAGDTVSKDRIMRFAAELGSDVPFFATRAAFAIGRGRGELVTEVSGPGSMPALIVRPGFGVSTREAYETLAASRLGSKPPGAVGLRDTGFKDWTEISDVSTNDFEEVLFAREPRLLALYSRLERTDSILTRLCGSGSAIIGIYADMATREAAKAQFGDTEQVLETSILGTRAPEPV